MNWKELGRYALSVLLVGTALALTLLVRHIHFDGGYVFFYPAVVSSDTQQPRLISRRTRSSPSSVAAV